MLKGLINHAIQPSAQLLAQHCARSCALSAAFAREILSPISKIT
ncbi:hypothetical protein C4K38_0242 [Pseudomonas chlororaphis subsp. piscium]|nr:hypothetical protein C4K38_0242 [Pseudomonas chlororaphis subsp. piscium]